MYLKGLATCPGEDSMMILLIYYVFSGFTFHISLYLLICSESIYRRGARRWRKLYHANGHLFQAKRFNHRAECAWCKDRIWGLGRQGYRCTNCRLLVHKRCHRFVKSACGEDHTASAANTASRLPAQMSLSRTCRR